MMKLNCLSDIIVHVFNVELISRNVQIFLVLGCFLFSFSGIAHLLVAQTVSSSWSCVHLFPSFPTPALHSPIVPPSIKAAAANTTISGSSSCPTHLRRLITHSLKATLVLRHPPRLLLSLFPEAQMDASLFSHCLRVQVPPVREI